jgi:hypothetical protein
VIRLAGAMIEGRHQTNAERHHVTRTFDCSSRSSPSTAPVPPSAPAPALATSHDLGLFPPPAADEEGKVGSEEDGKDGERLEKVENFPVWYNLSSIGMGLSCAASCAFRCAVCSEDSKVEEEWWNKDFKSSRIK